MSAQPVEQRLRLFLLALAAVMCIGTAAELWLANHTESLVQIIPITLCGLALAALLVVWRWPRRRTILALRVVMVVVGLGSALGMYEHLNGNLAFELEIRPNASVAAVWRDALHGAAPLLAPGILPGPDGLRWPGCNLRSPGPGPNRSVAIISDILQREGLAGHNQCLGRHLAGRNPAPAPLNIPTLIRPAK